MHDLAEVDLGIPIHFSHVLEHQVDSVSQLELEGRVKARVDSASDCAGICMLIISLGLDVVQQVQNLGILFQRSMQHRLEPFKVSFDKIRLHESCSSIEDVVVRL